MEYRDFGNTGIKVSKLGFGAMRLPGTEKKGKWNIDEEGSYEMMREAFESGINYIDTAFPYCHEQSEAVVGKAVNDWDGRVYVSSKSPTWQLRDRGDYKRYLQISLERLGLESIDFYHFHHLNDYYYEETVLKLGLLHEAQKAKDEGLIGHISFSFHDDPQVMKKLVDTGVFDSVLCQYNFLDTLNKQAIAYAAARGIGVAVMGPVAGGRVLDLKSKDFRNIDEIDLVSLALRFVFSNNNISTALSGMQSLKMVRDNIRTAEGSQEISEKERDFIKAVQESREIKEMIPCNECEYCSDCPNNIPISRIFKLYNYLLLTGLEGNTKWQYDVIGRHDDKSKADQCSECGKCEEACPQNIDIIEKLKEAHKALS